MPILKEKEKENDLKPITYSSIFRGQKKKSKLNSNQADERMQQIRVEINEKRIGKTLQKIKPTTGSFKRAEKKKKDRSFARLTKKQKREDSTY